MNIRTLLTTLAIGGLTVAGITLIPGSDTYTVESIRSDMAGYCHDMQNGVDLVYQQTESSEIYQGCYVRGCFGATTYYQHTTQPRGCDQQRDSLACYIDHCVSGVPEDGPLRFRQLRELDE